ncbi:Glutamyl-tRNA(Gln) amidotransferase subunit B mitochondrial [Bienertia sinuspersici]
MAAKISLSSSYLTTKLHLLPKLPLASPSHIHYSPITNNSHFRINAKIGGDESDDADLKKGSGKRKFITKDQEPEQ